MYSKKKRGLLASAGALVTAAALALGGAASANAAPVDQMPDDSAVIITKLEQPATAGEAANGLPITDALPGAVIPGVTFEAYAVPVLDINDVPLTPGTNAWQEAVADITVADAKAAIGATPTAVRDGITDVNGQIIWDTDATVGKQGNSLDRGLYLVRETVTPPGVVASGDFLLAVPLTHPDDLDKWLDAIYVYPKNRTLDGEKTVVNAEDFVVGDVVTWSIDLDNPSTRDNATGAFVSTDKFVVLDTIVDEYLTTTEAAVNVTVPAGLVKGATEDYTVALVPGTGAYDAVDNPTGNNIAVGSTQIQVTFTAAGRAKLAAEMNETDPTTNVIITIDTQVKKVGVIENSAQFYSSEAQTTPKNVPPTEVRYGAISLEKASTDDAVTNFAGAEFRVYLSEAAASAANETNGWGGPYVAGTNPNGYLTPADGPTPPAAGVFSTNATGEATIGGLRYSNFADGVQQNPFISVAGQTCVDVTLGDDGTTCEANPKFQTYWLVETKALDGHQLLGEPVSFLITAQQADLDPIEITNSKDGGFVLPLTGGMGTALLTILGVGILAAVLVVARRRQNADATAE